MANTLNWNLPKTTVTTLSDAKGAAIYFDYVLVIGAEDIGALGDFRKILAPPGWEDALQEDRKERIRAAPLTAVPWMRS